MLHRLAISLIFFALSASAAEVAGMSDQPLALIGFHEGARRVVECKNGFLTGVEVGYIEDSWSFGEPFIGSVRLICSNKTLSIEYSGDTADTFIFGRLELKTQRKAECEGSLGVAGFKWRAATIKNPEGAEARQAVLVVMCNRPDNAPSEVVISHSPESGRNGASDKQFSCKQTAKYAGLPAPKISKVVMWYNRKSFAGLEPLECA
ncbi:hypothetical protein VOLCADRAFT_103945 [Volvox carteri f. nagariensis]|uniref:Pherophorin domain-containing protein n=1 Tax=Volvox carteri f. nagariensis TaxID=3068 RepID=D8TQ75_VOLCA|nr:uncharacterized protein VOLCADRAFT_103945 [Volvox carteri f. nagariensis]EFJ50355.1 hypothetical protein VOLCADRAFT_103945 [Volvox carteri f. nagariensis]|eukprot:XP_002948480.1 hypothetical protein VOLCADRAFT_103945 [Volvox carteri f. nagariensis]